MESAVILAVDLPTPLEAFRQRHIPEAPRGLPAHMTLLYPWLPPAEINAAAIDRVRSAVRAVGPFDYELRTIGRWPTTMYVAPAPDATLRELAARLAAALPEWPLYGDGTPFEPHVSLGLPDDDAEAAALLRTATALLPLPRHASELTLMVEGADGRWTARERIALEADRGA